jgi:transcriptional regulator NrdR family protein
MNEPITFYCDLPLEELDNLEQYLLKYIGDGKYVIAHEVSTATAKSHFHVIAEFAELEQWDMFRNAILIKKYKLSAKNKQYGKVKKINDVNKMISYILKDDGPRRTNLQPDVVKEYLEASYKKQVDRDHVELAISSVPSMPYQYEYSDTDIICKKIVILEYFKKNDLDCNIAKVGRIFNMYLMRQKELSANQIYEIMRQDRNNKL